MKKNIFIGSVAVILIIVAVVVNYNHEEKQNVSKTEPQVSNSSTSNISQAKMAANFTLYNLKGEKVSLNDFRGKNVYINFWATWCSPCRDEMPELEKVYQQYQDKDLVVLAVNIGEDKETVDKFIKESGYSFNVLLDYDESVANEYNISSIPQSFFINKDGKIVAIRIGAMDESQMLEYIKDI